jgi:hypothetical protein
MFLLLLVMLDRPCSEVECSSSGYTLQSPVSPSLPLPCVTVCHHVSNELYSSLTSALDGLGGQHHASAGKESLYPLYRGLSGLQGRFGWVGNISLSPGFSPRTFQPVAGRYTDYATPSCSRSQLYNRNVTKIKSMILRNVSLVLCS